jgi:hypothetical protein
MDCESPARTRAGALIQATVAMLVIEQAGGCQWPLDLVHAFRFHCQAAIPSPFRTDTWYPPIPTQTPRASRQRTDRSLGNRCSVTAPPPRDQIA